MSLLEHLKSRYPDASIREGRELDLPCYIVSVDGMDLKVMRLHKGSTEPAVDDWLPRFEPWHNEPT